MSIIAFIPLFVCIIGLIVYLISVRNPKVTECGRIMFMMGLLVTLATWASHTVHIGS